MWIDFLRPKDAKALLNISDDQHGRVFEV